MRVSHYTITDTATSADHLKLPIRHLWCNFSHNCPSQGRRCVTVKTHMTAFNFGATAFMWVGKKDNSWEV